MEGMRTYVIFTPSGNFTLQAEGWEHDSATNTVVFYTFQGRIHENVAAYSLNSIYGYALESNIIIA